MDSEKAARSVREKFGGVEIFIWLELVRWALETGEEPFDERTNIDAETRNRLQNSMRNATRQAEDVIAEAYRTGYARDKKHDKATLAAITAALAARSFGVINTTGQIAMSKMREGMLNATQTSLFALQRAKYEAINKATEVFTQGKATWMQAKQTALNDLADKGILGFIDKAGRTWDLDAYVDMCVRTASANANRAAFDASMEMRGVDLVFVSSHMGSCPKCAPWQGKVLSRSGSDPNYPSVIDAMNSGLFHPNCGHVLFEYIEGYSTLKSEDTPASAERYRYSQRQRQYERNIRKWQRREAVALTSEDRTKAAEQVKFWKSQIAGFTQQHGLRRKLYRERLWDK